MHSRQHAVNMTRYVAEDFEHLLESFDLDAFDRQQATIYGLRRDYSIGYVNATWFEFAEENQAPDELLVPEKFGVRPITESMYGPLREHYESLFARVLADGAPKEQDDECSSPEEYRLFHMDIRPLPPDGDGEVEGLLVLHSPRQTTPADEQFEVVETPDLQDYLTDDGLLVACSNCRRFRHRDNPGRWDWIPAFMSDPPAVISHGLCAVCLDYYYRAAKVN